jgi:predicted secreted Zn-dependent protease
MPAKSDRPKSFDTMVKYFLRYYNIPTKKDMDKLNAKMDRLETLISNTTTRKLKGSPRSRYGNTASGIVLEVIREAEDGIRFSDLQDQTGFNEKKLRNIVFRLNKLEKIKPKSRGVYMPV